MSNRAVIACKAALVSAVLWPILATELPAAPSKCTKTTTNPCPGAAPPRQAHHKHHKTAKQPVAVPLAGEVAALKAQNEQIVARIDAANVAVVRAQNAAAAAQATAQAATAVPQPTITGNPNETEISLVRYLRTDKSKWPEKSSSVSLTDLYAKIYVTSLSDVTGQGGLRGVRDYEREDRGFFRQLFSQRNISIVANLKIAVQDPDLPATLPLFSITHNSGLSIGETFETNYTSSDTDAPIFRINPNSTVTVAASSTIEDNHKVDTITTGIKAATTALKIVAPHAAILTTLSKEELSKGSQALDAVIGSLVSSKNTETINIGRILNTWQPGDQLEVWSYVPSALIKAKKDDDSGALKPPNRNDFLVGRWLVQMTCPRPSIFSTRSICGTATPAVGGEPYQKLTATDIELAKADVQKELTSSSVVLSTKISSQYTVQDFIKTQDWYTSFVKGIDAHSTSGSDHTPDTTESSGVGAGAGTALNKGNGEKPNPTTSADTLKFCAAEHDALYKIGLNEFDAGIVIKFSRDLPGLVGLSGDATIEKACVRFLPQENFSSVQPTVKPDKSS